MGDQRRVHGVFTSDILHKAYANEISSSPVLEIKEYVAAEFAGHQNSELMTKQLENGFSGAGVYYEAKIDTCRTIAYGKSVKDAKKVALQALALTLKNGGELDDGFVDQMQERGVLSGQSQSAIVKAHPVHKVNMARSFFRQDVKYTLDLEEPRWTFVCHFGDDLKAVGHDETKSLAKAEAAKNILPL